MYSKKIIFYVGAALLWPTILTADPVLRNFALFKELDKDIKVDGYIYSSYNNLLRNYRFVSGAPSREFDIEPSGFTLHQAAVILSYQPKEGFGGLFEPTIGRDTYVIAPYGWNPDYGSQTVGFTLQQAYLNYTRENLLLVAGELFALGGVESLNPILNTNFSRGIIQSYATPNTVLGGRANYAINEQIHLTAGLNNGWDNIRDFNRQKTVEALINYTPNKMFSFIATGYFGGQRATDRVATGPKGLRYLADIVGVVNFNKNLSFITDYVYGRQSKALLPSGELGVATWQGVAGYLNYKFYDNWRLSVRGEWFADKHGFITKIRQNWSEATVTLAYQFLKSFELRAELRGDLSNKKAFLKSDSHGVSKYQRSYALEGLYNFSIL